MEKIQQLIEFLEWSKSEEKATLKEVIKLFQELILKINEDIAEQTASAMRKQKTYKVERLQREYQNNLTLLNKTKQILQEKDTFKTTQI